MISESFVNQKISALLRDEISLGDFENWFLPAAWNMFNDSSQAAISLASSIHLLLDEYDDHVLSEADFRHSLLALLNNVVHHDVRYQPEPVTSWVIDWSARPAQIVLKHVQV